MCYNTSQKAHYFAYQLKSKAKQHFSHLLMSSTYTVNSHPTCRRFWGFGSLVESKRCYHVLIEADSHLKLLPTFILDIYKVFEHIDMLSIGIQQQP